MSKPIGRRAFLRGFGGVAVALPALEILRNLGGSRKARADVPSAPKRYVSFFAGHNTMVLCRGYNGPLSLPLFPGTTDPVLPMIAPATAGAGYALPPGLKSFGDFDVQGDVSVVSGLKIPWGNSDDSIPPGGRTLYYHGSSVIPLTTGKRCLYFDYPTNQEAIYTGPTHDQVVADAIAGTTPFRSLNYGAQAVGATAYDHARISWRSLSGALQRIDNVTSPQLAYQTLFSGFGGADPQEAARAAAMLKRRKSVLDIVDRAGSRLLGQLGKSDKDRVSRHFDEIRTLENRLAGLSLAAGGACQVPAPYGPDPAVVGQEDARATLLVDLMCMALACDLTRVATMQLIFQNSSMSAAPITGGKSDDLHNLSHHFNYTDPDGNDPNGPSPDTVAACAWQVKHYARMVRKLRDMTDVDGKTVLDNTALVLAFEGGYGVDPFVGPGSSPGPHSTENMCVLVAGRVGGLKPGKHVLGTDRHPVQAIVSAMNAVGVSGGLGDVSGTIPELFS